MTARLPRTVVLATGNVGKLREMREILAPWHVEVRPLGEFTAAQNLAPARVMSGASAMVSNNGECSTEWGLGVESSNNANYCVCVRKPGYYKHDNWLSWDCQRRWW